jgi:hypothetical protein
MRVPLSATERPQCSAKPARRPVSSPKSIRRRRPLGSATSGQRTLSASSSLPAMMGPTTMPRPNGRIRAKASTLPHRSRCRGRELSLESHVRVRR